MRNVRALDEGLRDGTIMRDVLMRHGRDIIEQQRIQLMEGRRSDGTDIRPYYSEDVKPRGYFTTKDAARRYAAWKQTLSYPYTAQRNPDAPNLYVTGVFHDDLNVEFGTDAVAIVPDTAYASNIMSKYGRGMFGLAWDKWGIIFGERGAAKELMDKVRHTIWQ